MRPTSTRYNGWSPPHVSGSHDRSLERRNSSRVAFDEGISVTGDKSDRPVEGQAVDLSTGGMLMTAPKLYRVGSVIRLRLQLPENKELSSTAIVRSRVPGRGNGVAFLQLAPDHARLLGDLIRRCEVGAAKARSGRRGLYVY